MECKEKSTEGKDKPMTSVLLPEGELRVARCDTLDKLIAVGDGDAALLYLYILRHGSEDGRTAARALHLSDERYERAAFTLNNLSAPAAETKNTEKSENAAPQYTAAELRRARNEDGEFSAVCDAAENAFGRALTEGMLRSLLTAYDHLGLDGGAIIELLSYLKNEKGEVRLSDIKRETYQWADMGIVNAQDAQQYLARRVNEKPFIEALYRARTRRSRPPRSSASAALRSRTASRRSRSSWLSAVPRRIRAIAVWIIRSASCASGKRAAYILSARSRRSSRRAARRRSLSARPRRSRRTAVRSRTGSRHGSRKRKRSDGE